MFLEKSICVIIPAFNEADHIARVLCNLPQWVDHIVLVNDGSTDKTSDVAKGVGRDFTLIDHRDNQGVGAAISTGYRAALKAKADVAVVMAGDDQMCPAELPDLLNALLAGPADYAKGTRMSHPDVRLSMPRWRRLGNLGLTWWTRRLTGYSMLTDAQCGYTAIRASMLKKLRLDALPQGYGYPNRLLMMLAEADARLADVPVTPIYADESSGLTPWSALRTHGVIMTRATVAALWRRFKLSRLKQTSGLRPAR